MYKIIKIIIILNVLLFSLNIINIHAEKENNLVYQTESELFEIPGHGLLAIDVPKSGIIILQQLEITNLL